jgi:hypothetical protein
MKGVSFLVGLAKAAAKKVAGATDASANRAMMVLFTRLSVALQRANHNMVESRRAPEDLMFQQRTLMGVRMGGDAADAA